MEKFKWFLSKIILKHVLGFRAYEISKGDGSFTTVYTSAPMLDGATVAREVAL